MNILLTSCGLETEKIKNVFLNMLCKNPSEVKAIFIPTAAIDAWAVEVLGKCLNDLLKCGIKHENILVYDLHKPFNKHISDEFDVVYICGGNTEYLLERINENGFNLRINEFIKDEGVLIGVSAGSIIFANNLKNNLGLLPCFLDVHCQNHIKAGTYGMDTLKRIDLGDKQGIIFSIDKITIFE